MDILILGGTSFVGRAMIDSALAAGHRVAALTLGRRPVPSGVQHLIADRNDPTAMAAVLGPLAPDAVIDVSGMAARQVRISAGLLAPRTARYLLVSSVSVYPGFPQSPVGPGSPTVDGDPDDDAAPSLAHYATQKRSAELAAVRAMGPERTVLLRPGFILGPHENVGRVAYWCTRVAAGGRFIAPDDPARPFQVVDARDLAAWSVRAVAGSANGVRTLSAPPGRDTWGDWLDALAAAARADGVPTAGSPVWVPDDHLLAAGVVPGSGLPMWVPGGAAPIDATTAEREGFRARPLARTAADCWRWWRGTPDPEDVTQGHRPPPLSPARERQILADL